MNTWLSLGFQESGSFIMEQMIFFYDFSFLIISMVLLFVVYIVMFLLLELTISRYSLDNQVLEFVWTVLPLLILCFLAFPSIRILYLMDEMKNPLLSCKVLGHQWFWSYEYSDFEEINFDSYMILNCMRLLETDNCFVLPLNTKIRLLVSSVDVLHSWTVPAFGVKVDSIPGRLNQLNFTINRLGVYFGQCSEICGVNHSFMPIMVEVLTPIYFEGWVAKAVLSLKSFSVKQWSLKSMMMVLHLFLVIPKKPSQNFSDSQMTLPCLSWELWTDFILWFIFFSCLSFLGGFFGSGLPTKVVAFSSSSLITMNLVNWLVNLIILNLSLTLINSLFEIYDPYTFCFNLSLNWLVVFLVFIFCFSDCWIVNSIFMVGLSGLIKIMLNELSSFFKYKKMGSGVVLFISVFFFLLYVNLLGLVPYVFSCSAHFVFSVSLSIPFWVSLLLLGWVKFSNSMFIHLIPLGTPIGLISFMVFIETVSNFIRPWSLSIRIMANMISGHLLMSLLGDCGLYVILVQLGLFVFEAFVCFIQAFVFSALLTLYSSEIYLFFLVLKL